jgi:hypothetical protein
MINFLPERPVDGSFAQRLSDRGTLAAHWKSGSLEKLFQGVTSR